MRYIALRSGVGIAAVLTFASLGIALGAPAQAASAPSISVSKGQWTDPGPLVMDLPQLLRNQQFTTVLSNFRLGSVEKLNDEVTVEVTPTGTMTITPLHPEAYSGLVRTQVLADGADGQSYSFSAEGAIHPHEVVSRVQNTVCAIKDQPVTLDTTDDYVGSDLTWFVQNAQGVHATIAQPVADTKVWTITPEPGYVGPANVTYVEGQKTAAHPDGHTTTFTRFISLYVFDAMSVDDATGSTPQDVPVTVDVFDDAANAYLWSAEKPAHGTVTTTSGGEITYTPDAGYSGPDTVTWTAMDACMNPQVRTLALTVVPAVVDVPPTHHETPTIGDVTPVDVPPTGDVVISVDDATPAAVPPADGPTTTSTATPTEGTSTIASAPAPVRASGGSLASTGFQATAGPLSLVLVGAGAIVLVLRRRAASR